MAPPVKPPFSEPVGGWEAFQRLKPAGVFNDTGEILPQIDGTALLTLISDGGNPSHPHRPAIQAGVWRLLRDFTDRIDPLDLKLARQAVEHSGFLDPLKERPPDQPPGPARIVIQGVRLVGTGTTGEPRSGATVLREGGVERSGPSFVLRERRALQGSVGRNIVWEIEIEGEVPFATWQEFVHTAWDVGRYGGLLSGARLLVHFIGSGKILGGKEAVKTAISGRLTMVSEVILQTSASPSVQPLPKPSVEELRAASERLVQVRQQEAIARPNSLDGPSIQRITRLWRRFFASQDQPFISQELWLHLTDRLAKKIARYLPSLSETTLVALAQRVYEDLGAIRQYVEGKEWAGPKLVLALDRLSAEQITTLFERYPAGFVYKALTHSDPIAAIQQLDRTFPVVTASVVRPTLLYIWKFLPEFYPQVRSI